ncbi:MAG TPA: DNA polymerase I [Bacilli bacterium]|nr:DNA polymerase I [Bacilli bacterium]
MKKLIIIDGNSLLFRAYYATIDYRNPENIMKTTSGIYTNAIFAFSNMISKILGSLKDDEHIFVAFDTGEKTFRHLDDETYKANRKPAPEPLIVQFPIAREFLNALNIFTFELNGYEADDLAGTLAKVAEAEGYQVEIYTSDRDYLQLISPQTTIKLIKKGMSDIVDFTPEVMQAEYGFSPDYMIDYKALVGDTSDNIKGIPGVGDKTATKLILEYGHLDDIFAHKEEIKGKLGQSITDNEAIGRHAREQATIMTTVPLPFKVKDTKYYGYDYNEATKFASKYELKTFLSRLKPSQNNGKAQKEIEVETVTSSQSIAFGEFLAFSFTLSHDNYYNSDIIGLAFSNGKKTYYIEKEDLLKDTQLLNLLKDQSIKKYTYDYKKQKVALAKFNLGLEGLYFDLLLTAYLLDSNLKDEPSFVFNFFNIPLVVEKSTDPMLVSAYLAYYSYDLAKAVINRLKAIDALKIYLDIELPLNNVLAKMEIEGFPLSRDSLENIALDFKSNVDRLSEEIYTLAGHAFNINSPQQVAIVLYDELNLKENRKRSTSVQHLDSLIGRHPIVEKILEYRKYAKLMSTYVDGLLANLYPDGKLHCQFNQALTTTGRLSSSNPNMQNISIRDEDGREIRKAFFYPDDQYEILSLDYAQIELRILASVAQCKPLIKVFNEGYDIHQATADAIFGPLAQDSQARRKAKAVNFGIVYGISDWGLSEQLDISPKEAKEIIDIFYRNYPEIATYRESIIDSVAKNSYVTTLSGRRRYLGEINHEKYQVREFAKRAATNAPIQGTAADLIKLAMIKVDEYLTSNQLKSRLVLQIHDELVFKVHKDEKDMVIGHVKSLMENALPLDVKMQVEYQAGRTWFDAK